MLSISVYRSLLRLYPSAHRAQFGEEMVAVFGHAKAETDSKEPGEPRGLPGARSCGHRARRAAGTLASPGRELCRTLVFHEEVYDAQSISFSENDRRIDDDHSGRSCAGHQEGRNDFVLPCESSDWTTPADTLRFVGGHLSNPRVLLHRRNDRVGDSVRDAAFGSPSTSRDPGGPR